MSDRMSNLRRALELLAKLEGVDVAGVGSMVFSLEALARGELSAGEAALLEVERSCPAHRVVVEGLFDTTAEEVAVLTPPGPARARFLQELYRCRAETLTFRELDQAYQDATELGRPVFWLGGEAGIRSAYARVGIDRYESEGRVHFRGLPVFGDPGGRPRCIAAIVLAGTPTTFVAENLGPGPELDAGVEAFLAWVGSRAVS